MSALIFVALAVAWAVYLVPQALKQTEAGDAARGVDRFSDRLRVLARREAVDARTSRLVVPGRPAVVAESNVEVDASAPSPSADARAAAGTGAARRRRRVVLTLLALLVVVGIVAALGVVPMVSIAAPVVLLVAWLVACRLMVRREHADRRPAARPAPRPAATLSPDDDGGPNTEEFDVVLDDIIDSDVDSDANSPAPAPATPARPASAGTATATASQQDGGWDPVEVPLPTYVDKPAARRSVRTIDLDSTGVWTSGRTESDAALAREADQAAQNARESGSARTSEAHDGVEDRRQQRRRA